MNKSSIKHNTQAGFTLIELIVVIVILGILAATALPKFSSLGGDARFASLQAAKGALSATAAMAKGKFMANSTGAALTTLAVEDVTINFATTSNGYPVANAALAQAAGLSDDYTVLSTVVANTTTQPSNALGQITIIPKSVAGTPAALTCFLRYTEPATPTTQAPAYTLTASAEGCE